VEEDLRVFGDVNSSVNSSIRVLEFGFGIPAFSACFGCDCRYRIVGGVVEIILS
jgi:hypothetical protein